MKKAKLLSLCLCAACSAWGFAAATPAAATTPEGVEEVLPQTPPVQIDASQTQWMISKYLTGSHFVYAYESDSIYMDSRVSNWMKDSKVNIIRWPGGTAVQRYHWDDLSGILPIKEDTWDPTVSDTLRRDAVCFMDLDEFISYCRKVGAEPMVGVNFRSGMKFNKAMGGKGLEKSMDEAKRLIEYCKKNNYNVKYWYIGNEAFTDGVRPEKYVEYIDKYAALLKEVDPDITILADWKLGIDKRYNQVLEIAKTSKHLDIIEIHEKWGNGNGLSYGKGGTFEVWKKQSPIFNGQMGQQIDNFNAAMKAAGKHVKIGFNEWGLSAKGYKDADEFRCGLIASDFLLEMFRHQVETACYWNLNIGNDSTRILKVDNYCTANAHLNKVSVVANPFTMISDAMGKYLVNFSTSIPEVYGFAAVAADKSVMDIYLINKKETTVTLPLELQNFETQSGITQFCYSEPGDITAQDYEPGNRNLQLPALSFSHFVVESQTATGLGTVQLSDLSASDNVYDLCGHKVSHFQRGIYIVNGKKVMVK